NEPRVALFEGRVQLSPVHPCPLAGEHAPSGQDHTLGQHIVRQELRDRREHLEPLTGVPRPLRVNGELNQIICLDSNENEISVGPGEKVVDDLSFLLDAEGGVPRVEEDELGMPTLQDRMVGLLRTDTYPERE